MEIKITKYDYERNQFECLCKNNLQYDRFDPFVSGINNGDKYKELNNSMVGKKINVDVFPHGRCLLLTAKGEEKYKKLKP